MYTFKKFFLQIFHFLLIWFALLLWHINHCRLLHAKSSLYIYIKYIGFDLVGFFGIATIVGHFMPHTLYIYIYIYIYKIYMIMIILVWFYGISTIEGYSMPNTFHTYILNIWFINTFCRFSNKPELISYTAKWFHLFRSNMKNSIYY